jgi:hypothetical protein
MIQINFPPFGAKSVHPSVNLPPGAAAFSSPYNRIVEEEQLDTSILWKDVSLEELETALRRASIAHAWAKLAELPARDLAQLEHKLGRGR